MGINAKISGFILAVCLAPLCAQNVDPCEENTQLTGGTTISISTESQKTGTISGTDYEYELWHNTSDSKNTVTMKYYGADQGGGAAFRGEWDESNTKFDYLARIGYKFEKSGSGSGKLYTEYDDIYADYNYTRSGRLNGYNYSYIGIYGWARAGTDANLVEFYIVDDWWGNQYQADNTPVGAGTICDNNCSAISPDLTIDGGTYKIYKNSRTNEPSIEGNQTNFDQYFSVRQTLRKCGTISITEHFKAWDAKGLKLGKLYEAKILAEVGAYSASSTTGWIDYTYASMRMGGSSGTTPSSSSSVPVQATTCKTPLIEYPTTTPDDPYTACFKYTNGKCYVCNIENEGEYQGNVNSCASSWVWDGSQIESNLTNGYWYYEVDCPTDVSSSSITQSSSGSSVSSSSGTETPIKLLNATPSVKFGVRSLSNGNLLIESDANIAVYLYDTKGNVAQKIQVPMGSSIVKPSIPAGLYVVKNAKTKQMQVVVVR